MLYNGMKLGFLIGEMPDHINEGEPLVKQLKPANFIYEEVIYNDQVEIPISSVTSIYDNGEDDIISETMVLVTEDSVVNVLVLIGIDLYGDPTVLGVIKNVEKLNISKGEYIFGMKIPRSEFIVPSYEQMRSIIEDYSNNDTKVVKYIENESEISENITETVKMDENLITDHENYYMGLIRNPKISPETDLDTDQYYEYTDDIDSVLCSGSKIIDMENGKSIVVIDCERNVDPHNKEITYHAKFDNKIFDNSIDTCNGVIIFKNKENSDEFEIVKIKYFATEQLAHNAKSIDLVLTSEIKIKGANTDDL